MHSDDLNVSGLAGRIQALERSNHRLAVLTLFLAVGLVAVCVMGPGAPERDVVEARGLVIRDAVGTPRIVLGIGTAGAQVALSDSGGVRRLLLASESAPIHLHSGKSVGGPAVLLTGPSRSPGPHQVALESNIAGSGLCVWEGNLSPTVALGVSLFDGPTPQVQIHSLDGSASAIYATVLPEGEVGLWPPGPSISITNRRGDRTFGAPNRE